MHALGAAQITAKLCGFFVAAYMDNSPKPAGRFKSDHTLLHRFSGGKNNYSTVSDDLLDLTLSFALKAYHV